MTETAAAETEPSVSVQFHSRIPPEIHKQLRIRAAENGTSINDELVQAVIRGLASEDA